MADGAEACPTCGMEATVDASLQPASVAPAKAVFEPGPSFNEPASAADVPELPSWLQNFGAVEETPAPALSFPIENGAAEAEHASVGLPNWLAAPRADQPASAEPTWNLADGKFGDQEEGGFISEDDLPDWLRSIGGDNSPDTTPTVGAQVNGLAATAPRELRIPAVVSAWVAGRETAASGPGESLFAHIASEEQLEAVAPDRADVEQAPPSALPEAVDVAPVQAMSPAIDPQAGARSRRMLMYVAIAMLVLLLLIMFVQR
jgi:hypothetical protein